MAVAGILAEQCLSSGGQTAISSFEFEGVLEGGQAGGDYAPVYHRHYRTQALDDEVLACASIAAPAVSLFSASGATAPRSSRHWLRGCLDTGATQTFVAATIYAPKAEVAHQRPRYAALVRFKILLQLAGFRTGESAAAFGRQLDSILGDENELLEQGLRPSHASFLGLLRFMRENPNVAHPALSLDSAGNFVASWQPQPKARISLTFQVSEKFRWIAVSLGDGGLDHGSGSEREPIPDRFRAWMLN